MRKLQNGIQRSAKRPHGLQKDLKSLQNDLTQCVQKGDVAAIEAKTIRRIQYTLTSQAWLV